MNLYNLKASIAAAAFTFFAGVSSGSDRPDLSLLLFRGLGWEQNDNTGWVGKLLQGPDNNPIGISFERFRFHIDHLNDEAKANGPWRSIFEGVGWTLRENFGYSGKLLLGPDRSVVGISLRVWNNSLETPLVLMREAGKHPFFIDLRCDGESMRPAKPEPPRRARSVEDMIEWTLPPRGKEEFFVPVRDLLPADFDPGRGKPCHIDATVMVQPKGTPPYMQHSPFPSVTTPEVMLTKTGLATDIKEALRQAAETADKARVPSYLRK